MGRIKPFRYEVPEELDEAVKILSRWGGKGKVIAGGTDLVVQMKQGIAQPECLVSLRRIRELQGISENGKGLSIGSMASLWDVEHSSLVKQKWPLLGKAVSDIGSPTIRTVATIGGNLCNGSPAADCPPSLLVIEAVLHLKGIEGKREASISDFFKGPSQTILRRDEILYSILLPPIPSKSHTLYLRLGRRAKADLALVGVALILVLDPSRCVEVLRIGLGGVSPKPFRARRAEALATGKVLDQLLIREIAGEASEESQPISDIRGSAGYKREMVAVLVSRGLKKLSTVEEV